jgi:hypothetical protein
LYASLKEAKEAAKLLQEEKMKTEQEVNLRKDNMRVSSIYLYFIE